MNHKNIADILLVHLIHHNVTASSFCPDDVTDLFPCTDNNGGCGHLCNDSTGQVVCSCLPGYVLDGDNVGCIGKTIIRSTRSNIKHTLFIEQSKTKGY